MRLLADDPETRAEIEAEQARMRALRYQERRRMTAADMRALSAANKRGPDSRFVKG